MKKKLLSEAQVRRFMGLAGLNPLNEMAHKEDEIEEGAARKVDDAEVEEGAARKKHMMEEEDPMDEPEGMEDGDADIEIDEEDLADVKAALDTLQDKLAPLLDQAEGGEDMEMDPEAPAMDDEDPMDEEPPPPSMDDGGVDAVKDDIEEELMEIDMDLTEEEKKEQMEEIVNEVARRVAKRIVEAKRAQKKMNEALGRSRRRK